MVLKTPHLASPADGGEEHEEISSLYLFAASNLRSWSLPRFTASSRAVLASFLPDHTDSNSSSTTSRICTKLPMRRPLEFGVGGLSVSCFTAMSRPGNFL